MSDHDPPELGWRPLPAPIEAADDAARPSAVEVRLAALLDAAAAMRSPDPERGDE